MTALKTIGAPPWTREQILIALDEFAALYEERPIRDNLGGMRSAHMFALWFMARALAPKLVIESGIWKGQSTWLLEQACPKARIISIDLDLSSRQYISDRAEYSDRDFAEHDWSQINPDESLAFFDDHQNAYTRLQQCRWFRFKHIIFEDNYPNQRGDCYSLKKAFAGLGFEPDSAPGGLKRRVAHRLGIAVQSHANKVRPNTHDAMLLQQHLETYAEFPPIFMPTHTRWGDAWAQEVYPTPSPLMDIDSDEYPLFKEEARDYTWICYARLED